MEVMDASQATMLRKGVEQERILREVIEAERWIREEMEEFIEGIYGEIKEAAQKEKQSINILSGLDPFNKADGLKMEAVRKVLRKKGFYIPHPIGSDYMMRCLRVSWW